MSKEQEIENIQKNMQTIFEGYVNGQKFTNRDLMNAYIGQCISEGIPITDMSYSTTTKYKEPSKGRYSNLPEGQEAIRRAQKEISWVTYINGIGQRVPQPYENVIGYVVPFVRENININKANIETIIDDFRDRLNDRLAFLENYVFSQIRTWKYDVNQVNQWLDLLAASFNHKLEWANKRVVLIEDFLNNEDVFITSHIDPTALVGFHDIYAETAGFCSAVIDIIAELQQALQQ